MPEFSKLHNQRHICRFDGCSCLHISSATSWTLLNTNNQEKIFGNDPDKILSLLIHIVHNHLIKCKPLRRFIVYLFSFLLKVWFWAQLNIKHSFFLITMFFKQVNWKKFLLLYHEKKQRKINSGANNEFWTSNNEKYREIEKLLANGTISISFEIEKISAITNKRCDKNYGTIYYG